MTGAFHGDAAVKADLLDRLRRHAQGGTLDIGATGWDGVRGSPMGVSAESEDSSDYARRFGYPLALAGALDTVTALDRDAATGNVFEWVDCVRPGADLFGVPLAIVRDLLERLRAPELAPTHHAAVMALHEYEAAHGPADRAEWTRMRHGIEAAADVADGARRDALLGCALASWPIATSRSVLVGLVDAWIAAPAPDPHFDEAAKARAKAVLDVLVEEVRSLRDAGEVVSIPALFREREPELSARFEANLARRNAAHRDRSAQVPSIVLRHLAAGSAG